MTVIETFKAVLAKLQTSPNYPDRKVINGAVAGAVGAVVVALGLAASPLVAAVAAVVIAQVVAYLVKPSERDVVTQATKAMDRRNARRG